MAKGSFGVSLDLDRGRLATIVVDPGGHHQGQLCTSWTPGKPPGDIKMHLAQSLGEVVLGLPEKAVHTRYLELPTLKPEAQETALRSQVMRYFPFQAQYHSLTSAPCPPLSGDKKKKGFVVFLIDKQVLQSHNDWLKELGCKVSHVEFTSLALVRWLNWEKAELRKGPYIWIDCQPHDVEVGLVVDRLYYGSRRLRPPLVQLNAWREGSSLSELGPYVDYLANQVAGAVAHFCHRISPAAIEPKSIVLTGKWRDDETLQRSLKANLNQDVSVVTTQRLGLDDSYRVAAGLSLRSLEV